MNIKFQSDDSTIKVSIEDIYGDDDRSDAEFFINLIKAYTGNPVISENTLYDSDEPKLFRKMSIVVRR